MDQIEIEAFQDGRARIPFKEWIDALANRSDKYRIEARLARVREGNFGDVKRLGGGIEELRLPFGPGYRIYFVRLSARQVVVLSGGTKATQVRDIQKARIYYAELFEKDSGADHQVSRLVVKQSQE